MKLNSFKTLAIGSVIGIAGAALPASAQDGLRVSVPFAFQVGETRLPAGDYSVTQSENGMLLLTGAKASAMVMTVPADYTKGDTYKLSFVSKTDPVLTSVQMSGAYTREIPNHITARKEALVTAR